MTVPQPYRRKATDEVFMFERLGDGKYKRTDTGQEFTVVQLNRYYQWDGKVRHKLLHTYTTTPNGFRVRVTKAAK